MRAVLFLYVCVQASKEIIKLKFSVYAYISSSSTKQKATFSSPFSLFPPPPSCCIFHRKDWFGKHTPPLSLFPPCLPNRAQPRSPFSPFVIHLASSFHCRDKRAQCIVGRLSLKKGPLPCVCCGRAGFMLPPHTQKLSNTHSSLVLSFWPLRPQLCATFQLSANNLLLHSSVSFTQHLFSYTQNYLCSFHCTNPFPYAV